MIHSLCKLISLRVFGCCSELEVFDKYFSNSPPSSCSNLDGIPNLKMKSLYKWLAAVLAVFFWWRLLGYIWWSGQLARGCTWICHWIFRYVNSHKGEHRVVYYWWSTRYLLPSLASKIYCLSTEMSCLLPGVPYSCVALHIASLYILGRIIWQTSPFVLHSMSSAFMGSL